MIEHEIWMHRCIQLAKNGKTTAPPNPMVGAVVVCDEHILGEGYHARYGFAHAEVNALAAVTHRALLTRSTLYVSLEPCAHYGKTPPCAELIIRSGIPRVVVGCVDPFAKVQGRGIQMLRDAGIAVEVGICEAECVALNRSFFTFHAVHRPFITLKWAQSADGFIDHVRTAGSPALLSTSHTTMRVHRLRAEHQAILVGTRTALLDNPSLTVRHWSGASPLRVVLDRHGVLPRNLRLFDGSIPTLLVGKKGFPEEVKQLEVFTPPTAGDSLAPFMAELYRRGVQSLLVEGGATLLQRFIEEALWDEASVELSSKVLLSGVSAPFLPNGIRCDRTSFFGVNFLHATR
ncbi:MAG: bifunctional diaminohydroxyphosphoribosylaminopyrimidine deaminase/5-amino-6-(5-phosphoribosylamino)uracil reductase RibD [Bacteroidaceae bacterium]